MRKRSGILLAYPLELKRFSKWQLPFYLQPKLDGERCVLEWENGFPVFFSSTRRPLDLPHLTDAVLSHPALEKVRERKISLDGELYIHGKFFEEILSIVSNQNHPEKESLEFHVFDVRISGLNQIARNLLLDAVLPSSAGNVQRVDSRILANVPSEEELGAFLGEMMSAGYEGLILRSSDLFYEEKRSTKMMKFKPKKFDSYRIVEVLPAISQYGDPLDIAGKFICTDEVQTFSVGAGQLSHDERRFFLKNRDKTINKTLLVAYQSKFSKTDQPRIAIAVKVIDLNKGGKEI